MNKRLLALLLVSGAFTLLFAMIRTNAFSGFPHDVELPSGTWEEEWRKVDSLDSEGLYGDARELATQLTKRAREERNESMHVKGVVHVLKYNSYLEENPIALNTVVLRDELAAAQPTSKAVLYSLRAELYWTYFQENQWELLGRTETVDVDPGDIETWDLRKLLRATLDDLVASLSDKSALQAADVGDFRAIVVEREGSADLRPTLYDILAHRALDILSNEQSSLTESADRFEVDADWVFEMPRSFSARVLSTQDSLNFRYHTLRIFQSLEEAHVKDGNVPALVDVTLRRLEYVKSKSIIESKDSLYLAALKQLDTETKSSPASTLVLHAIALEHDRRGNKFHPHTAPEWKGEKQLALGLCKEAEARYPKSRGAELCGRLSDILLAHSLRMEAEHVISTGKPSRALVTYSNVTTVHQRLVAVSESEWEKWGSVSFENLMKELTKKEPVWKDAVTLPVDADLNGHSVEIGWPEMKAGRYVMLISANPDFGLEGNGLAYCKVQVSNLSLVPRTLPDGTLDCFVMDRTTGAPVQGANVIAKEQTYDYKSSRYKWNTVANLATNAEGMCTIDMKENSGRSIYLSVSKGNDQLKVEQAFYQYRRTERTKPVIVTEYFTDRSIYRPGQTIYFKGIMLELQPRTTKGSQLKPGQPPPPDAVVKAGQTVNVTLYNVVGEEVSTLNLVTNEFGTFHGSFIAPQGNLNGEMSISDGSGSTSFSVEDYKRPKFEVTVDPVKEAYRLGDEVTVKGKAMAYAGSNVDGATVKYRVVRQATFPFWSCWYWWRPYPSSATMEIAHGETTTAADGTFAIPFKAIPDKSLSKTLKPQFTYQVYVDVVDITGETRSSSGSVSVGYVSLSADVIMENDLDIDQPQDVRIRTTNLNGQPEPAKGTIAVYALQSPNRILRDRLWSRPDKFVIPEQDYRSRYPNDVYDNEDDARNWKRGAEVWKARWDTGVEDSLRIPNTSKWAPGKYVVELLTNDKFGEEVKVIEWITVTQGSGTKMPYASPYLFNSIKTAGEPGEKASFAIGSSFADAKVLYEVWHRNSLVSREWIKLGNERLIRQLPIEERHRGNFSYSLMMVREGRMYSETQTVIVPWTNKKLDIEVETFRDKLLPGAKEEWKIILKGKGGDAVAAELLAGCYDASLDYFRDHSWYMNPHQSQYIEWSWQSNDCFATADGNTWTDEWNRYRWVKEQEYDYLNLFGFEFYYAVSRNGWMAGGGEFDDFGGDDFAADEFGDDSVEEMDVMKKPSPVMMDKSSSKNAEEFELSTVTLEPSADARFNANGEGKDQQGSAAADMGDVKVRTNLNETAFFFPDMKTNEKGEVVLSFTMPEALTRWKFMLLGHTKDLRVGQYENTLVTQKDIMVMPNPPRFMREGDKIFFTAKVSNLTAAELSGAAQLELMDALTGKSVDAQLKNVNATVNFTAAAGQSAPLSWELSIPEGIQALTWRVKAKAGNFTDGEESSLPVLTNRMLVTESMPLPIRPLQTKSFNFERMSGNTSTTLRHHKYTLEFTSNPAWYAIQALPYMMEYPYECSEQTFSRFYANSIATHVANSHPRIKAVFDSWKNVDKEALLSNLEKNQELKYLLLEETPWVMDANSETERKQRVGLLFDLNKMAREQEAALKKLQQAQVSNGAWPWFPGMPESEYITRHIVCGMGHLDRLGVKELREDRRSMRMVEDAIGWLDIQMKRDYDWIMTHAKDPNEDHLSHDRIHYMYARSFFMDMPIQENHQKAYDYFLGQMEKYWKDRFGNRYTQGMIALALHRNERKDAAMKIMRSLKDNALRSEEFGMYWKKDFMGGWGWYEAPIEEQSLLIEAFGEVAGDMESVEEMKIWLLKQKQTQDWKTTRATAEACYALLFNGTDYLAESGIAQIKVGGQLIDPMKMEDVKVEAGTGYFKTSWPAAQITPSMGKVEVTNPNKVVGWGAVYWQYFEQLDKITSFRETGVKINKQLFLQQNSPTGPVITPVTAQTALKPGDLIKVRIEIRCDRDMDYVHMKDMRASGLEPVNVISRYKWQDGLGYYESTRDAATNFFFERLPKGTWVFEYPLRVNHRGDFSNGITTLQCMYAPEFTTHSEGVRVLVR